MISSLWAYQISSIAYFFAYLLMNVYSYFYTFSTPILSKYIVHPLRALHSNVNLWFIRIPGNRSEFSKSNNNNNSLPTLQSFIHTTGANIPKWLCHTPWCGKWRTFVELVQPLIGLTVDLFLFAHTHTKTDRQTDTYTHSHTLLVIISRSSLFSVSSSLFPFLYGSCLCCCCCCCAISSFYFIFFMTQFRGCFTACCASS